MSRPGVPRSWPVLVTMPGLLISKGDVVGELAAWAVRQSPYVVPDKLAEALAAFSAAWPAADYSTFSSIDELRAVILEQFPKVPEIMAWNERKNKRQGIGFVSRYDQPHPDDDFIDLDAMARNMAMALWHVAADDKQFNDAFDAEQRAQAEAGDITGTDG